MHGKHRLWQSVNGVRWSSPRSGVVFVTCLGDVCRVDGTVVGSIDVFVDTGRPWLPGDN